MDQNATLASATDLPVVIAGATDTPTLANTVGVITGSKIYGIYLKVLMASNEPAVDGAVPNVYLAVMKNPGGNLTNVSPPSVGGDDNKRFVIHQEMSMLNNIENGVPTVLFNGVIKIPKGYSRFGPNDTLLAIVRSNNIDVTVCMQAHFKEFR